MEECIGESMFNVLSRRKGIKNLGAEYDLLDEGGDVFKAFPGKEGFLDYVSGDCQLLLGVAIVDHLAQSSGGFSRAGENNRAFGPFQKFTRGNFLNLDDWPNESTDIKVCHNFP